MYHLRKNRLTAVPRLAVQLVFHAGRRIDTMPRETVRSSLQIGAILFIVGLAAITGWACDCGSGSDHPGSFTTHESVVAAGLLDRFHDFTEEDFVASTKDINYFRDWTERGEAGIGILLPQASGASQPGTLTGYENSIWLMYDANGHSVNLNIPLTTTTGMAANLDAMFPPPPGLHWQALVPANYDWLSEIPTQTTSIENIFGSLFYEVDFHGEDFCSHCEVKLTGCSTAELSFSEQAGLWAFGGNEFKSNSDITCKTPVTTYILPSDGYGNLVPGGPLIASFGFWGGSVFTSTMTSQAVTRLELNHTAPTTQTFNLAPVFSEQGWTYTWEDLDRNPITQLQVGPLVDPLWETYSPNLLLEGSGLPTCTRLQDSVHLTATLVNTPTVIAATTAIVQVLPDPNACNVADVGITQSASAAALNAGEWVTFTLTVTNFESAPVSVMVTDTLSSASAIGTVLMPAVCSRSGTRITCNLEDLAAGSSEALNILVQVSQVFTGVLTNRAWAEPVNATDNRFYDNATGPVDVTVTGGTGLWQTYLPLARR
jgi:uncharacterized repeat protein (TIGR01451 family)